MSNEFTPIIDKLKNLLYIGRKQLSKHFKR